MILELAKTTWGNPTLQKLTSQPQMYSKTVKKETQENEPVCKETGGIVVNKIVCSNKHKHTVRDGKEHKGNCGLGGEKEKKRSGLQNSFKTGNKVSHCSVGRGRKETR